MKVKDIIKERQINIDYRPAQRAAMDTVNPADFSSEREYARQAAAAGNLAGVQAMGGNPAASHPVEPPTLNTASTLDPGEEIVPPKPIQSGQPRPAAASQWNPGVLGMGSNGSEVEKLQRRLGINPADGKYGPMTKKAVEELQKKLGVPVDGAYGPVTKAAHDKMGSMLRPAAANTGYGAQTYSADNTGTADATASNPNDPLYVESIDRILTIAGLR